MLKIKLAPFGKKHQRYYRVSVCEEHSKLTGKALAVLGHYFPLQNKFDIDLKEYQKWVAQGAQPTEKIRSLIKI